MRLFPRWRARRAIEAEMGEEMKFHLDSRIADLVARGMPPQDAARTARLEFGHPEAHREECRAALGYRIWDEIRSDLRFAARGLRNHPGYSATAIAILALAIGANSAFFTLFTHHVLKPMAIRGAERHFDLHGLDRRSEGTGGWTAAEIDALRQASRQQVEDLYTTRTIQVLILEPEQRLGLGSFVSGNYFRLLGGSAAIGRTFSEPEQRDPVAVLSPSGQRRHFADDPAPVGKKLRAGATVFTVIGVMPPEFTGTEAVVPDFWTGAEMYRAVHGRQERGEPRYSLSGLLAPGASQSQAEAALTAAASRFSRPGEDPVARVRLRSRFAFVSADEDVTTAAGLVFAAFLMVLIIACANLANLCLSRAAARTHEIAMRLSLGASRARIVRQLLTESTFIALLGAGGGIALGAFAIDEAQRRLAALAGGMGIVMLPVAADWRVVLFSAGLGVLAGLAFGLLPAIEVTAPSLALSAKRDTSFAGRVRPRRMRNTLIAGQVASSLVLLLIAGILIRHIQGLGTTSPGYDLDRIFDLKLDRPQPALLALLEQQPFVSSVSAVQRVPLYGDMYQHSATAGGRSLRLSYNYVDHRFFETLALPVEGRSFTAPEAATNSKVVVISRATARTLWPGGTPLGQSITIDQPRVEDAQAAGTYQVIGVVPDIISGWLHRGADATAIYFPAAAGQAKVQGAMVRINGQPASAIATMRRLCAAVADATGCEPTSLREVSSMQRFPFAAAASVAGALGMLALVLTAVGLYSVTSYSVVQRRREIGVHLALGALPAQITHRLLVETWRCVAAGLAVGLPVCLMLSRLVNSSVLGIQAFDAGAYVVVPALLALITTLACALPARRAAGMDPMVALREE